MRYEDVRLSDYLDARYAPSTLDVLLDPMVRMTGGSAAKLSLASMFSLAPTAFERHYAFATGNGVFPERLAELCPPIETGRSVVRIVVEERQVRGVVLDDGERIPADVVVCATDARVAATLLRDLRETVRRPLADIEYSHRLDVLIGIERRFLESWALVIPQSAGSILTYLIDETAKSPQRAPAGRGLIKAMIAGEPAARLKGHSDEEIVERVIAEIQRLLPNAPIRVLCSRVVRHPEIIPMMRPGYLKALARLNEGIAEIAGLVLIGDYQSNGTIEGCVARAEQATSRILEAGEQSAPSRALSFDGTLCEDRAGGGRSQEGQPVRHFAALSLIAAIAASSGQAAVANSSEVERLGTLELQIADDFDGGSFRWLAALRTRDGRYDLDLPGSIPWTLAGKKVRVSGRIRGRVLSAAAIDAEGLDGLSSPVLAQTAESLGEQRTLVTLVHFLNDPSEPFTTLDVDRDILDETNPDSTASYTREASYDRAWLTGDVLGWFAMGWDDAACNVWTSTGTQQVLDAVDPFVDFSTVDRWIIVIPPNLACGFNGISTLGKLSYDTADGIVQMSRAIINNVGLHLNLVAAHELGHGLASLQHASDYECGGVVVEDGCEPAGLGSLTDRYDLMGHTFFGGHFSPPNKQQLGWFSGDMVEVVPPGGSFSLAPYETTAIGTKVLRIPVSWVLDDLYGTTYYYVSYRKPIGFDDLFSELATDGAMIHVDARRFVGGSDGRSRLLDATPHVDPDGSSQVADSEDVLVEIGGSFVDSEHGVTIDVLGLSGGGLEVSVSISQYCGNAVADAGTGEECDGGDLGANTCASIGYTDGILSCTPSCGFDTGLCGAAQCGPGHTYVPGGLCSATILSDAEDVSLWRSRPSWAETRESPVASNTITGSSAFFLIRRRTDDRTWIYRDSFPFDTSSIPDDRSILSARLLLKLLASGGIANSHPDSADQLVLVRPTLAIPPVAGLDDFDQFGSLDSPVEGAPRIDVGDSVVAGEIAAFDLDASGLSWIDPVGWTTLGVRGGYDVDDVTVPGEETELQLFFRTSESPVAGPRLVVSYTALPEPGGPVMLVSGIALLSALGRRRMRP
ncbi:MAG: FAD-dependent oxidoreductase, partial [Myxococcota bacterium]